MTRFYFKYTPVRRGLTGHEYLGQYIDEYHSSCKWYESINKDLTHYGYLEGEGDALSVCIQSIEGRFSAVRLTVGSIIGEMYPIFTSLNMMVGENLPDEEETPMTYNQFLTNNDITIPTDLLTVVKESKSSLFKEISKKRFADDNDSIADLSKAVVLFNFHYDDLTVEEKALVDGYVDGIKLIYTKKVCIHGFTSLVDSLNAVLAGYYTAKTALTNAETIQDALDVVYE